MVVDHTNTVPEPADAAGDLATPLRPSRVYVGLFLVGLGLVVVVGSATELLAWGALAFLTVVLAALLFADPRLALLVYAFSIPLAQALTLSGWFGNVSKVLAIVFVLSWLATTRGILHPRVYPPWLWILGVWALTVTLFQSPVDLSTLATFVQLLLAGFVMADAVSRFGASLARGVLWALSAGATITGALAVGRYLAGITQTDSVRTTAFSSQGLAEFGTVMAVSFMFVFMLIVGRQLKSNVEKVAAYAMLVVLVVGLLISGTRSAWVSFLIAIVIAIVLYGTRGRVVALAAIGAVAIALLLSPSAASLVADRATATLEGGGGSGRTEIWRVGALMAEDQPILGVGLGGYQLRFASTVEDSHRSWPRLTELGLTGATSAHSIYVGTLVELGIVGFVLLGLIVYDLLWRDRSAMPDYLYAIVLSLFVQGLFLDLLTTKIVWLVVALAFGVIASGYAQSSDGSNRTVTARPAR